VGKPPQKFVSRAAGIHMPANKIPGSPNEVLRDPASGLRSEPKMIQILVKEQGSQRRDTERHHAHPPKWHLRLQEHCGYADPSPGQSCAAQLQIFSERSPNMIRNPFSARRRKFGNDKERQLRVNRLNALQKTGDQVV